MNKNIQGHLFALTANILWGLMAPIGKSALVEFSALSVTTFRMVGAAACFWLLSLFCNSEQVDHRDIAEDILRRTLRTGIQSGCLYLRTLHDFAHRRLHRYNHAAYRHHDSGCNLSERTGHQQESAGHLCRGYGSIYTHHEQPDHPVPAMAASSETFSACSPKSASPFI